MTYAPRRCARCGRPVPPLMDTAVAAQRARRALDTMRLVVPSDVTVGVRQVADALACWAQTVPAHQPEGDPVIADLLDLAAHLLVAGFAVWLVLTLAAHVAHRIARKRPTYPEGAMNESKGYTMTAVDVPDLLNRILAMAEHLRVKAQAAPAGSVQRAEGFAGALAVQAVAQLVAETFTATMQANAPAGERQ